MEDKLWINKYEKVYRESADRVLFEIQRTNWNPNYQKLKSFCKYVYTEIVNIYSGLEKTREYVFSGQVLSAINCNNKSLAFCVGEGFTRSEISATHTIGWELQRLMDGQRINPEPFDLKLLVVGYKRGGNDNNSIGQPLPILKISQEIRTF